MTLRITGSQLDEICRHAERAYPAECCGALVGRTGAVRDVTRAVPLVNRRTDHRRRYLIEPDDLRRLERELATQELDILGYYHSHPDQPPVPSGYDAEQAWPWYAYLIVQVDRARATAARAWVLDDDRRRMHLEPLEVLSEV